MELLITTAVYMGICILCYTIPAICLHRKYQNRTRELEESFSSLYNVHRCDFDVFSHGARELAERIYKLEHPEPTEGSTEEKEEDLEEPDDIRIMESEEYLFSDRKKMVLWYDKKDDKLWCTSKDTDFMPCIIAHPSKIIGDGLSFFGFRSDDDQVVYVRNNKLEIDFMIKLNNVTIYTTKSAVIIDKLDEEEEPVKDNECRIKNVDGHYEVYINGEFCCSADTMTEAAVELEKAFAEEREEGEE